MDGWNLKGQKYIIIMAPERHNDNVFSQSQKWMGFVIHLWFGAEYPPTAEP